MKRFIIVNKNGKKAININSIVNFKSISSDETYIDFYSYDYEHNSPFKIERVEANLSFDDICKSICESDS